jgi:phosphomannomutase/phosphoglucomutase
MKNQMHNTINIDPSIFRAYDIRGIVDLSLTEESVYLIGRAIGSYAQARGEKRICIGRDGRLSGPSLSSALAKGIMSTGCDVIDLGVAPTPVLYYSTHELQTGSGVMLTGSHNPPEYNGLKTMIAGKTLAEDAIQELYQRIITNNLLTPATQGTLTEINLVEKYLARITGEIELKKPLKIVIDCGNGVAAKIAPELCRRLGCEVVELFCEIDGRFPNHHPDPSQAENLQDLMKAVRETEADIGLAFDGDGDRLGVVTSSCEIIWPDRLLMLLAQDLLKNRPGSKIIYDVKCSNNLEKVIRKAGGEAIICRTGHSLIKSKLAETNAALAGEMSGHIFFNDDWYGFDDAIYAAARLLKILANVSYDSHTLFDAIPNSINTPELKIYVTDHEKFDLMEKLVANADFGSAELLTIDGLRVNFIDGWGLVRPSNTTPCLVLRFEADTTVVLDRIKNNFRESLLAIKPDLVLPF